MGKKKPFIDKKIASTFHVVRRSQRDVGGYFDEKTGVPLDIPQEFILMPSPQTQQKQQQKQLANTDYQKNNNSIIMNNNNKEEKDPWDQAKTQLKQAGLIDDYDYNQHIRPITGTGIFISKDLGKITSSLSSSSSFVRPNDHTPTTTPTTTFLQEEESMTLFNTKKKIDIMTTTTTTTGINSTNIQELDRQFDSITLTATCLDEDIAHALFDDYDENEFEELNDDFCIMASSSSYDPTMDNDNNNNTTRKETTTTTTFDFDAHIAKLLQKARRDDGIHTNNNNNILENHTWWKKNQNEFHGIKATFKRHHEDDNDDDDDDFILQEEEEWEDDIQYENNDNEKEKEINSYLYNTVHRRTNEEEKALCEKFQHTLAEYDDSDEENADEDKDNDDDEMSNVNHVIISPTNLYQLEGDTRLESLLDEYLTEKKDEIFMEGIPKTVLEKKRDGGGSSFMVLSGKQMVREEYTKQEDYEPLGTLDDILAEADQVLIEPVMDLPPEEVFFDGKSYFAEKIHSPWDCESILSTYSNLDNNPSIIGRMKRPTTTTTKKKTSVIANKEVLMNDTGYEQSIQLILSRKTGLPLLNTHIMTQQTIREDPSVTSSVHFGVVRRKDETKEEKHLRKAAAKEQKQVSRVQKKLMKTMFQAELSKRTENTMKNDIGGVSVFRYS